MCTHKNTAPYSISFRTANVYTALTPLYKNNVYIFSILRAKVSSTKGTLLARYIFSSSHAFFPIVPNKRSC